MVPLWRKAAAFFIMSLIVAAWFTLALTWLAPPVLTAKPPAEPIEPAPEDRALVERLRLSVNQGGSAELAKALAEMLPAPGEEETWAKALAELSNPSFSKRDAAEALLRAAGTRARGIIHRHARFENDPESRDAITRLTANTAGLRAAGLAIDALVDAKPSGADAEVLARAAAYLPPMVARDRADAFLGSGTWSKDAPPAVREARVRAMAVAGKPWAELSVGLDDPDAGVRLATALAGFARDEESAARSLFSLFPRLAPGEARLVERILLVRGGPARVAPPLVMPADAAKVATGWAEWWPRRAAKVAPIKEAGFIVAQMNFLENLGVLTRFDLSGRELDSIARPGEALACGYGADGEPFLARSPEGATGSRIESIREAGGHAVSVPGRLVAAFSEGEQWVLVARERVERVGPEGRFVIHKAPGRVLSAAARAADGWFALWHDDGTLLWIDQAGKEKHRVQLPIPQGTALGLQALPGRRLLVPLMADNRVAEFTDDGVEVDSVPVETPLAVRRLSSGRWLVATPKGLISLEADGRFSKRIGLSGLPSGLEVR